MVRLRAKTAMLRMTFRMALLADLLIVLVQTNGTLARLLRGIESV
jgi:hypothetical protein